MHFSMWILVAAFVAPSVPFALLALTLWGLAPLFGRSREPGILGDSGGLPRAVARPRADEPVQRPLSTYVRIAFGVLLVVGWVAATRFVFTRL